MSVDRKRKILSTILFKAIGMSLNLEKSEDRLDTAEIRRFLKALGLEVFEENIVEGEPREFLNLYMLLYTSFFGNYEEIRNTLVAPTRSRRAAKHCWRFTKTSARMKCRRSTDRST